MKLLPLLLKITFTISLLVIAPACSIQPTEINYGSDGCHYCKMTIVDKQHAAQIVTNKGKAFKYDAIECMMNDLRSKDTSAISYFLINDYSSPGKLVDATSASFLVSKAIPSPMGEFLSGFSDKEIANKTMNEKSGQLYNWNDLIEKFK